MAVVTPDAGAAADHTADDDVTFASHLSAGQVALVCSSSCQIANWFELEEKLTL